jgi:sulfite reductase alpha subunit-like flavoprotein
MDGTAACSSCTILWSTQSGRAKACARRVARILREQTEVNVTVGGAVDDFGLFDKLIVSQQQQNHAWVFLISTTGDGEQCDSIRQTWKAL